MANVKRKVSVSLDEDLVEALERGRLPLSAQVNEAVRVRVEHDERFERLDALVSDLTISHGVPDESTVEMFMELLD